MDNDRRQRSERDARKRSRSPHRDDVSPRELKRQRSRSPHRHRHHQHSKSINEQLPFESRRLHKRDFEACRALFAEYLDLQKQLNLDDLDENEAKGRWKSFLGKWNRAELAEGWYDPETKRKADERVADRREWREPQPRVSDADSDEEGDGYGPSLPKPSYASKSGPTVPSIQELQHRQELSEQEWEERKADLRHERKQERQKQKERLDDIVPRAEAGTRERQLEKRREVAASNRTFAEAKESGAEELGESDLMGDEGMEGYKAKKKVMEKQKNEREIRKEEVLRARGEEREERLRERRAKEEKTLGMLKELARQRFGGVE